MVRIFTGELAAGQRLPPERALATSLGVDRTSLRMALKQLSRMGLIEVVHGSGITVRDYMVYGGIEFLSAVFAQEDLPLHLLPSFLIEAVDTFVSVMPELAQRACARATQADFRRLTAIFDRQRACLDDLDAVLSLEIDAQDEIARFLGSTIVTLTFNSARPLRRRLLRLYFSTIEVPAHVEAQRALVTAIATGRIERTDVARLYRAYLVEKTAAIRALLAREPAASHTRPQPTPRRPAPRRPTPRRPTPNRPTPRALRGTSGRSPTGRKRRKRTR